MYFAKEMFIIPKATIKRAFVGKRTLHMPSLRQKATIRFCSPIPIILTRGRRIGIRRKAFADPLPIKNSKIQITKKIMIIAIYGLTELIIL